MEQTEVTNCLNCGAALQGPFCHACGQKHETHRHSFWAWLAHFVGDFFHFDAQLFTTLKPLFLKPGLVPKDFSEGKRKRHLDPIRMYVFVSLVFFALLYSVTKISDKEAEKYVDFQIEVDGANLKKLEALDSTSVLDSKQVGGFFSEEISEKKSDSLEAVTFAQSSDDVEEGIAFIADDTAMEEEEEDVFYINNRKMPKSLEAYQEEQAALPRKERDGWIARNAIVKYLYIKSQADKDGAGFWIHAFNTFLTFLPKVLFVLLPFFALILKLLYVRREVFYLDHLVFMTYFLCFLFMVYSVAIVINKVFNTSIGALALIWSFFYLFFAMKRFYQQSEGKTFIKYLIFGQLSAFITAFALLFGFFLSLIIS